MWAMKKKHLVIVLGLIFIYGIVYHGWFRQPLSLDFSVSDCIDGDFYNGDVDTTRGISLVLGEKGIINNETHNITLPSDSSGQKIGIQKYNWLNNDTLYAEAVVLCNCADKITYGNYQINGNELMLQYNLKKAILLRATCMCVHRLIYKIKHIEKKDYEIKIEKI